jgi:hypothetical protein
LSEFRSRPVTTRNFLGVDEKEADAAFQPLDAKRVAVDDAKIGVCPDDGTGIHTDLDIGLLRVAGGTAAAQQNERRRTQDA